MKARGNISKSQSLNLKQFLIWIAPLKESFWDQQQPKQQQLQKQQQQQKQKQEHQRLKQYLSYY